MSQTVKKAIVTGGSRGIGKGIALKLAERGYDIAISYKSCKEEAENVAEMVRGTYGKKCHVYQASLEEKGAIEDLIKKAYGDLGGLTLYVNNAGLSIVDSIFDIPTETIDLILSLDFRTYLIGARDAGRLMVRDKVAGSIINISSVRGTATWPGDVVYGACKAGINKATKALALNLAPYGIRVNTIAPGNTDIRTEDELRREGVEGQALAELLTSGENIPIARRGTPEDMANAVVFLASEQGSYITGITLTIDGGLTLAAMPEHEMKNEEGYYRWGYAAKIK